MFFNSWPSLLRIVIVGVPAYLGLVLFLRIAGKRTLSKMNAFDLVVTVSLGSTLASTLLSRDVALAEGLLAFGLLIGLQYVIAWSAVRSRRFQRLIKAQPRLLAFDGRAYEDALRSERVSEEEFSAALRDSGLPGVESTYAVIMETDGTIAVIPRHDHVDRYTALGNVRGMPERGSAGGPL